MTALRTERLVLDAPRASDIDAIYRACQDPQIHEWVPLPDPYTLGSAEYFVCSYVPHGEASGSYTVWAIRVDDESLIGVVEMRRDQAAGSASIGCWLAAPARGSGYMREALARVVAHAFDPDGPGLTRLRWEYLIGNEASKRLATDVGFDFTGRGAHSVDFRGESREAVFGVLARPPAPASAPPD